MTHSLKSCHPSRIAFDLPELLEIQRGSFYRFLEQGISDLFSEIPPIRVEQDDRILELLLDGTNFQLISPDENPRDCILKMKTYSSKLYVKAKVIWETHSGERFQISKDEWILVGHLPIMTKRGHFIINGSPRVIVHQVVRSPGIYFQQVLDKDENKRIRFYGDIIPFQGVWLRLQITKKGKIEAKFKKGKKVSAVMLQKCLQFIERQKDLQPTTFTEKKATNNSSFDNTLITARQMINKPVLSNSNFVFAKTKLEFDPVIPVQLQLTSPSSNLTIWVKDKNKQALEGEFFFEKIPKSAEIAYRRRQIALEDRDNVSRSRNAICLLNLNRSKGKKIDITSLTVGQENKAFLHTYDRLYRPIEDKEKEEISKKRGNRSLQNLILMDIRLKLKKCYKNLFSTFKEKDRYNLSDLGREKINTKLGIHVLETQLTALDIKSASTWLHKLTKGEKSVDDIDHFQNRRIRTSGELLQIQLKIGIDRLAKLAWNKLKEHANSNSKWPQGKAPKNVLSETSFKERNKVKHLYNELSLVKFRFNENSKSKTLTKTKFLKKSGPETVGFFCQLKNTKKLKEKEIESFEGLRLIPNFSTHVPQQILFKNQSLTPNRKLENKNLTDRPSFFPSILLKDLLNTKAINGALRELFGANPLSQYMDQTNPLAEITHKRRMSSLGLGGVSRESAGMAIRGIHPTHYGRICPIETPEGKNAGLVNSLAFYSKINDRGFVETPYYKVVKGQVQQELGFTFFSAKRESVLHLNIAPSDLQQSGNNKLTTNSVPVRVADNLLDLFQKVHSDNVNCIGVSPIQMISVATSLIPFLEHNDANRALMGSNMQRQAVPLMISERPIVGTGLESLVVTESGHLRQASLSGFLSYVSADKIVVESLRFFKKKVEPSYSKKNVQQKEKQVLSNKQVFFFSGQFSRFCVNTLNCNKVEKKKASERSASLKGGEAFTKVLHPLIKKAEGLCSTQGNDIKHIFQNNKKPQKKVFDCQVKQINNLCRTESRSKIAICDSESLFKKFVPSVHKINNFDRSNQDTCLMQRVSAKEGDWILKGDILTDCSASDKGELAVGKNILVAYMPWEGYNFEDAIVINERLVKEHVYTSLHIERYEFNAQDVKEGNEWFTKDLPGIPSKKVKHLDEFGLPKIGSFVKEGDILIGKMRYSNKKPTTPYERLLCDILGENNFSARDSSLYVPKGVHARVIQHKIITFFENPSQRTELGQRNFVGVPTSFTSGKAKEKPIAIVDRDQRSRNVLAPLLPSFKPTKIGATPLPQTLVCDISNQRERELEKKRSPKFVHIFLGEKRAIQVGDKMSGRHGNKGVVAAILPKEDMPYLADGTPIDIVLNPLGVPSRMNVGQVFESLLGLAGTYLTQHFKMTAFDERYGIEASQSLVYLKLYQARLQSGQNWLFQVDFPGKTRLIDGRSGQSFDQWVTVGRAYILKLIHMVHEKIHARATGPYALITQQPLRGRSQKGGQRLGEMEVWALEGFGAAYTLQELLTKKSDDMVGRKEVASAILPRPFSVFDRVAPSHQKEENRLMLGQPEIFKVLICELQALCLDVGVYSLTAKSFQRSFLDNVN